MSLSGMTGLYGLSAVNNALPYLLREQFTTDAAAPLGTHTCEPGPGSIAFTDTNNVMSIASSRVLINGTTGANNGAIGPSVPRQAGWAFFFTFPVRTSGTAPNCAFSDTALSNGASDLYFDYAPGLNNIRLRGSGAIIETSVAIGSGVNCFAYIMRSTGCFMFVRNGTSGNYTLLWISKTVNAALAPKLYISSSAVNWTMDDWWVGYLGAPWHDDHGIATARTATTSAGSTSTQLADAMVEHTITAATGVTQDFMVRRTDDNNCWIVRCNQGASTIAIIEKNAGVETSRNSVAHTWTNGTQYRVVVRCEANVIKTYVATHATANAALKNTYSSASFNNTATGVKVSDAGTELVSWPLSLSLPAPF